MKRSKFIEKIIIYVRFADACGLKGEERATYLLDEFEEANVICLFDSNGDQTGWEEE